MQDPTSAIVVGAAAPPKMAAQDGGESRGRFKNAVGWVIAGSQALRNIYAIMHQSGSGGFEMAYDSGAVEELVRRIVEVVHPQKIILFGSAARGEMKPGSDIDVLVVMPEGAHRRRIAQLLYRRIRGLGVPFDILVATSLDLQEHKDNPGLIYRTVLQEGREAYVA
jgi:predicted nucleotidyltransferase